MKKDKLKVVIKNGVIIAIMFVCVVMIILMTIAVLFTKKKSNSEVTTEALTAEDTNLDNIASYTDAESYFEENATLLSKEDASKSMVTYNESAVLEILKNRGFSDCDVTTQYSIDGEYYQSKKISSDSTEKHPMYDIYYTSASGDIWIINIVRDRIFASPASYNLNNPNLKVQIVISEFDSVISYDSYTNMYYETIPNETELLVIKEDKIDRTLLDSLTSDKLDEYIKEK